MFVVAVPHTSSSTDRVESTSSAHFGFAGSQPTAAAVSENVASPVETLPSIACASLCKDALSLARTAGSALPSSGNTNTLRGAAATLLASATAAAIVARRIQARLSLRSIIDLADARESAVHQPRSARFASIAGMQ